METNRGSSNCCKTKTAVTNKNDGDMIYESAVKNKARAEFWSDYGKLSYTELIDKYIPYSKKKPLWIRLNE